MATSETTVEENLLAAIIYAPSEDVAKQFLTAVIKTSGITVTMNERNEVESAKSYELMYEGDENESRRNLVRNAVNNSRDMLEKLGGSIIGIIWRN